MNSNSYFKPILRIFRECAVAPAPGEVPRLMCSPHPSQRLGAIKRWFLLATKVNSGLQGSSCGGCAHVMWLVTVLGLAKMRGYWAEITGAILTF